MRNLTFFVVLIGLIVALDIYAFYGVNKFYKASKSKGRLLAKSFSIFLSIVAFICLAILFAGLGIKANIKNFFLAGVFINYVTKLCFAFFLLIDDLRRLLVWVKSFFIASKKVKSKEGISRSDFLTRVGIGIAAVPALGLPYGMAFGPYNYKVHKKSVKFPNLPKSFNGLKIVQISDIHVGSFYNKEAVNKGIDLLLAQKPDVVFFTGDIVNDMAVEMDDYYDVFSRVTAPMGVYSILGNHDYGNYHNWNSKEEELENFENVKAIHTKLGWNLLLNEHVYLEKNNEQIGVIGIENWGKGFHQEGDMAKAYLGCSAPFKILLSHDPTHWDEQVRKDYKDVDLTLSGHTHGAQVGIETGGFRWSPIQLRYKKWAGLYQRDNQYLYINRGFGFLGYPGRLGIWPEITVLELERA